MKIYNIDMEIKISEKFCIITPFSPRLDNNAVNKLLAEIEKYKNFKIGLDMSYVNECSIEFIDFLSKMEQVGLFNITSDVFALFNIMNIDKIVDLFVSEIDFKADKHQLLNRKFCII